MHPAVEGALAMGLSALQEGSLHSGVVPNGALVSLRSRRAQLEACLAPASTEVIVVALASLGNMPGQSIPNPTEVAALAAQDVEDLADVPGWALVEAARAYRRGEVGDGKWRPTAGQLRKEAIKRATAVRGEVWRIKRLLDAPSLTAPAPVYVEKGVGLQLLADMVTMLESKAFPAGYDGDVSYDA
jgi:hypothetical protein